MIKKLLPFFFTILYLQSFSQSDNCSSATVITPNTTCIYTSGTSAGATQSIPGCVGNADDDVWYQFTATQTSHQITVSPSANYDPVVQLFSGGCAVLNNLYCEDLNNLGQAEVINATGLTIGTVYHFRVYDYWAGSGSSTFSVCVSSPPTPPVNDACANATPLTPNSSCVLTSGTSYGATQSYTTVCNGTPDDDVWYTFVANSSQQVITVNPSANMDAVVELLSGTCSSFTSLDCIDNSGTGGTETATENGLTPGTTYYVRVFDYWSGNGGYPFTICITGAAATGDDPCNAFVLPPVTSDCNYISMSNSGFTSTSSSLAPTPANCGGSGAQIGGFSASSHDVWFALTVPASGNIYVTSEPNLPAGAITDGVMALYSGTCGSLTQIMCDDDHNYPGTAYDLLPYIAATGLTPGATVYIRYWGYGSNTGEFGLCVSSPTNDACSTALYICDLNNYVANTNGYTPDRPCNMRGDAEFGATYTYTPGSTTSYTAAFGMQGPWGTGQPTTYTTTYNYDVSIDNNSWIKFTASAATASFSVTVGNCFSTGGIQMQVFSGTNCCAFIPVSDFEQGNGGFTLNATSLTIGQDYYLMVDGWGGDLCSYTVTANSGVQIPSISATPSTICFGDSTKLAIANASAGSTYLWFPGGQTTSSITVAPPTDMTYSCQVSGVCGNKQTLSKAVTVNALPTVQINGAGSQTLSICANTTTTLTASGGTTYSWSPATGLSATSGSAVTVTPTATTNTTYTVTGTNGSGCKNTAIVTIQGLSLPSFSITNVHPNTCNTYKDTLTAVPTPAGTYTYSWSNGASTFSINPTITANTVFTATVTDVNNCKSALSSTVTVLALPSVTANTATICAGQQTATLTANGASTYTWNSPATLSSPTGSVVTATPTVTTTYTITGTGANGCNNTGTTNVTVNSLPNVTVNSATVCAGVNTTLTAHNATTYSWSTTQGGTSISVTPTVTTSYTVTGTNGNNCTNTAVATVSVNPVPTLTAAPTISPSNCGASTGSITAIGITPGSGSLSYTWTNSLGAVVGNSQNINNQPAGAYNVHVADANCSANFGPYSITNPGAPPAPTITTNTTTACVGQSINVSASSGAASPTYTWTGPGGFNTTNSSFTLNPTQTSQSGTYVATLSSAGCSSTSTVAITVNPLPSVSATTANNPYCAGATVNLNGSSASSYTWSGPGGYASNIQSPQIINSTTLTTGVYTLTVTDANGCQNADTANVTVNQTPTLSGVGAAGYTLCENQTLQLHSVVTPTNATVQWSGPNGFSSNMANPSIMNISTLASGTYSVTATVGNCSSATSTLNITVNTNPVASANVVGNSTVCAGSNVTIQGGAAGNSYNWNGPAGTATQQNYTLTNVPTSATGTYTLVVTNSFNCKDSATVPLTVNPTPVITSYTTNAVNNTICIGSSIQLNAIATPTTATLQWSGPNGYTASAPPNPVITPTVTGTYTVVATVGSCQSTGLDTVRVRVNPIPTATATVIGSSTVCSGNTIIIAGGVAAAGNLYSWNGNAGTSTQQNYTLTNVPTSATGTYTLVVTNSFNCKDSATASITVNQTPVITSYTTNAANNTICQGQSIQLIATATATPASVQIIWTGSGGYTSPPQSTTLSPTTSGTYTVSAIATPGNCVSTGLDTIHITVNPKPIATATNSTTNSVTCSGTNVTLTGGAAGYPHYNWSGPAGYTSTNQNNTLNNVQTNPTNTYTLVVTNSFNCTDTATTSFTINQTPGNAVTNNVKTCTGGTLTLNATGNGTINWYSNAALTNLVGTGATFNPTVPSGTTTIFYVVVTSTNNCVSATTSTVSVGNYNVQVMATASTYNGNAPLAVNFAGQIVGSTNTSYSWTLGDNATSTLQNPSHTYNSGGDYTVILSGTDSASSCVDTAMLTIHVTDEMVVVIPNVFTPNGDGINDGFFVTTKGVKNIEGFVMNRWGQLMFEWTGLNSVWDGRAPNGNPETEGTYFYVVTATSFSGKTEVFKGPLTLIR
jgi:gliding motility-associated-like protein